MEFTSLKSLWAVVTSFRREEPEDRRRESRLPAHGPARILWDAEGERSCTQDVNLLGISEHGCSFRTTEPLAPDQTILIEQSHQDLEVHEAVVRHVTPDGNEYVIGAQILFDEEPPEEADQPAAEVTTEREP